MSPQLFPLQAVHFKIHCRITVILLCLCVYKYVYLKHTIWLLDFQNIFSQLWQRPNSILLYRQMLGFSLQIHCHVTIIQYINCKQAQRIPKTLQLTHRWRRCQWQHLSYHSWAHKFACPRGCYQLQYKFYLLHQREMPSQFQNSTRGHGFCYKELNIYIMHSILHIMHTHNYMYTNTIIHPSIIYIFHPSMSVNHLLSHTHFLHII